MSRRSDADNGPDAHDRSSRDLTPLSRACGCAFYEIESIPATGTSAMVPSVPTFRQKTLGICGMVDRMRIGVVMPHRGTIETFRTHSLPVVR